MIYFTWRWPTAAETYSGNKYIWINIITKLWQGTALVITITYTDLPCLTFYTYNSVRGMSSLCRRIIRFCLKPRLKSQNHWVSGLLPPFDILKPRKHNISKPGCVCVLGWERDMVCFVLWNELTSFLCKGPHGVPVYLPSLSTEKDTVSGHE
jgi:hypothetical protein